MIKSQNDNNRLNTGIASDTYLYKIQKEGCTGIKNILALDNKTVMNTQICHLFTKK